MNIINKRIDKTELNLTTHQIKFGLGKRLAASFTLVALMTVLVSAVSWFNINQLSESQSEVADLQIPAISETLKLANEITQLSAVAPLLKSSSNTEESKKLLGILGMTTVSAKNRLKKISGMSVDASVSKKLSQKIDEIIPLISKVGKLVENAQHYSTRRSEIQSQLFDLRKLAKEKTEPLLFEVDVMVMNNNDSWLEIMEVNLDKATSGTYPDYDTSKVESASSKLINYVQSVLHYQSGANLLVGLLAEGSQSTEFDALKKIEDTFLASIASLAKPYDELSSSKDIPELEKVFKTLLLIGSKGDIENNIFKLRTAELESIDLIDQTLAETRRISNALTNQVNHVVSQTEDSIEKSIVESKEITKKTVIILLLITILAIAVALSIGWFYVAKNLVQRLMELVSNMQRIANGDLATRVNRNGSDEISQMATSLAVLRNVSREAAELKEKQEEARQESEREKSKAALEMANEFDLSVGQSITTLATNVSSMEDQAKEMHKIAGTTLNETVEISRAADVMSNDISTVASSTEQLSASISEISHQVSKSTNVSQDAVARAAEMNGNISRLQKGSQKIESVIDLINTIAEQTNLLALNATIEAARAGEAGKGFAVVASEVKNLAQQTTKATEDISVLIGNVQGEISGAVEAASRIDKVIFELSHISSSVSSAVEEQGAATQEISRAVSQSSDNCTTIAQRVQEISASLSKAENVMGNVVEGATLIDNESSSLSERVESFISNIREDNRV